MFSSPRRPSLLPLAIVVGMLSLSVMRAEGERTWTNNTGQTIVATLVGVSDDKVVLQMGEKSFEVPLASLSADDQAFISEWGKKEDSKNPNPSETDEKQGNWDAPWPTLVSTSTDPPIEVVKEDKESGEYIYTSPHYEFLSNVRLNASLVKRFSVLFEATNQLCQELPLGLTPSFRTEKHKIRLFETREEYIANGGPPDSVGVYRARETEGEVLIPLTSLGVKKVASSYSIDSSKENHTISHELTHQLTDFAYFVKGARGWFSEGLAEYVGTTGYRSGKFNLNNLDRIKARVTAYGSDGQGGRALGTTIEAPDLQEFLQMDYSAEFLAKPQLHYGLATLIVYYYFHMDGDKDAAHIKNFLRALKEGKKTPEIFELLLAGRSWDEMEAAISQAWRSRGIKITFR